MTLHRRMAVRYILPIGKRPEGTYVPGSAQAAWKPETGCRGLEGDSPRRCHIKKRAFMALFFGVFALGGIEGFPCPLRVK